MVLIGICGGSGSGKSWLANSLSQEVKDKTVQIISQDDYYHDFSFLNPRARDRVNFDHPDAVDFTLLKNHLLLLKSGVSINQPCYDFQSHTRLSEFAKVYVSNIVIVEGLLILYEERIRRLLDKTVFISMGTDVCLNRRIARDVKERGRSEQGVIQQWTKTVQPMYEKYVYPSIKYADIVISDVLLYEDVKILAERLFGDA